MLELPKNNVERITLLNELLDGTSNRNGLGNNRDNWDAVSLFDSAEKNEIEEFIKLLQRAASDTLNSTNLQEISSLMRNISGQIKFGNEFEVKDWVETSQTLISKCDSNHRWRLEYGAEWYHDAINSVCGNATHSAVTVILINPDIVTDEVKENFRNFIAMRIQVHIEVSELSHAEPIIATLGRNAIWLDREFPNWLQMDVFASLNEYRMETSRAFWQGFLVSRKWDMPFLRTSSLEKHIIELLSNLQDAGKSYDSYLGRDSSEAFIYLLVELFLRTPNDTQLHFFSNEFITLQVNTDLFLKWLDYISWSMHKIDFGNYPELSDNIYECRIKPLLNNLNPNLITPQTVGMLAELLGSLRKYFPQALADWRLLGKNIGCQFSQNSRILMWLTNGANSQYLVDNFPDDLIRFIQSYLKGFTRDGQVSDWELSEFIMAHGRHLLASSPDALSKLSSTLNRIDFRHTLSNWPTSLKGT